MNDSEPRTDDADPAPAAPAIRLPAIVLVRPQLAENIGAVARAMLNFGLTDLRLVAPRDGWPNPDAGPSASGADEVLAQARLFDTVNEAVADCTHVFATTVRRRGVTKPVVDPAGAVAAIRAEAAPTAQSAILFGPERAGLESDDVALARTILTIAVNPGFSSLNLAQAVILIAYEWSREAALHTPATALTQPTRHDDALFLPASQSDVDGLVGQMESALDNAGFFWPPERSAITRRLLRTLLTKPGWSAQEVRTLRGMISALVNPRPSRNLPRA